MTTTRKVLIGLVVIVGLVFLAGLTFGSFKGWKAESKAQSAMNAADNMAAVLRMQVTKDGRPFSARLDDLKAEQDAQATALTKKADANLVYNKTESDNRYATKNWVKKGYATRGELEGTNGWITSLANRHSELTARVEAIETAVTFDDEAAPAAAPAPCPNGCKVEVNVDAGGTTTDASK